MAGDGVFFVFSVILWGSFDLFALPLEEFDEFEGARHAPHNLHPISGQDEKQRGMIKKLLNCIKH